MEKTTWGKTAKGKQIIAWLKAYNAKGQIKFATFDNPNSKAGTGFDSSNNIVIYINIFISPKAISGRLAHEGTHIKQAYDKSKKEGITFQQAWIEIQQLMFFHTEEYVEEYEKPAWDAGSSVDIELNPDDPNSRYYSLEEILNLFKIFL